MASDNKMFRWFDRIIEGMAIVAGLLLLFMMFSICYEVILRYFHFRPPTWVTEISEYILLYVTFLGAPWVLREEGHVKVDVVVSRFPLRTQRTFDMTASIIGVAVCAILVWFGAETTWDLYKRGIPVIKALEVPKFLLLGVIPFGSFFLIIQFLRRAHRFWAAFVAERISEEKVRDVESGL
jgi:TRAP-type C4-dicarboxylate transport system permease small subunit